MIHLTLPWIKAYAVTDSRFRSGFMLYQKEPVTLVEAGARNSLLLGFNDASYGPIKTVLYFYQDTGTLKSSKCECHQQQPCEHVIAGLLYVLYKKEGLTKILSTGQTNRMYSAFEDLLVEQSMETGKKHLSLEVVLSPRDVFSKVHASSVQFKVIFGNSSYVVRQIEAFVMAVCEDRQYEITKNLVYDQQNFSFDAVDLKAIELLYDYYKTRKHLISSQGSAVMTPLKASVQILPGTYLTRLFEILEGHCFNIDYDGLYFRKQEIAENLEVDFYLTDDREGYLLSVNTYDVFFPITEDYRYIFFNNQIYRISKREKEAFKLFCHYLKDKVMTIGEGYLEDFINKVKPVLEMIGYVHMDNSISERLASYPLKASLYIEKEQEKLFVHLNYRYGPYVHEKYPEKLPKEDGRLVVHNLEKEKIIEQLLKEPNCHWDSNGYLVYDTEEDLYYFIDRVLPRIQHHCEVFYSEDFKNTYMKPQKELKSSIRYNAIGNLLELDFEMEDISRQELYDLLKSIREKKHYYRLKDGSFFTINDAVAYQIEAIDERFGLQINEEGGPLVTTTMANAFYLDMLFGDAGQTDYSASFNKIVQRLKNSKDWDYPVPEVVTNILRDYQKNGFRWLMSLKDYGLGGILADDMGLGKTLQAITLMISSEKKSPSIVIAPTSLIYNWEEEIHKFAPEIKTRVIAGAKNQRLSAIKAIEEKEIIITSYGSMKRDLNAYECTFDYCIIDEAQHIKNPRSQNALAVKSISAGHRFALTGTPIENTLTELWSIFDFILPGYLGSHASFMKNYEKPIVKDNDAVLLNKLTQLIQPFILRRLKEDVLTELPPKIETKVSVELSSHQKKLYMAYVQQAKADVSAYSNLPEGQRNMKILSVLTRLRQLCCHPALFVSDYSHGSSKLELLMELLEESIEGGHKVLVFSQFTSMLGLIKEQLEKQRIEYHYLDGTVAPIKRQQMVHDFNAGINDVFLISLKAGGTGLNLTGADVVIHYDPWWNPAVENQATDRAYRIGQRNRVQVYKLITAGTIEEKIYQLQQKKLSMIDSVIRPGETFLNKLSIGELHSLFMA